MSTPDTSEAEPVGEPCPECGFDESVVSTETAEEAVRSLADRYHRTLDGAGSTKGHDARLRHRPVSGTWSALEYVAHVRDVIALWGWALHKTLVEDQPVLPAVDPDLPDRTAAENAYNSQEPKAVDIELSANAERMADKIATIKSDQWGRTAHFGEIELDALWIVRKVAHEGHHHLLDIERCLAPSRLG
jgi:hypothetical protein